MENNENTTVKPNENSDEDYTDELEKILSQLDTVLNEAHRSCDSIDHILSALTPEVTPEVAINIEQLEPNDPSIEIHSDARIAEEEPAQDAVEIIEIEESTGAVVEELPTAANAAVPPGPLPEFDDCFWKCNECEMFTVTLGVGVVVLFFIICLAFLKEMADGKWD